MIVGAGPAGLACAACLTRRGVEHVVLERAERIAPSWHSHYDRLHLHTNRRLSHLPGLRFPADVPRYPSRDQVISYLGTYARHWDIRPRFGHEVVGIERTGDRWRTRTSRDDFHATHVIVASGYNHEPIRPSWPGLGGFPGPVLHSADYRNGVPFRDQDVLVVGFGNSGGEIAVDLTEHGARASLAVRSPVNLLPRELFRVPILALAIPLSRLPPAVADALSAPLLRGAIGDPRRLGLRPASKGVFRQILEDRRIPVIDVGTVALLRTGRVSVRPGLERIEGPDVIFTDGTRTAFDAIVLATGFRPGVADFLAEAPMVTDETGVPRASGRRTALPGLWFCGFHVSPTGMLREVGREARRIAHAIARNGES